MFSLFAPETPAKKIERLQKMLNINEETATILVNSSNEKIQTLMKLKMIDVEKFMQVKDELETLLNITEMAKINRVNTSVIELAFQKMFNVAVMITNPPTFDGKVHEDKILAALNGLNIYETKEAEYLAKYIIDKVSHKYSVIRNQDIAFDTLVKSNGELNTQLEQSKTAYNELSYKFDEISKELQECKEISSVVETMEVQSPASLKKQLAAAKKEVTCLEKEIAKEEKAASILKAKQEKEKEKAKIQKEKEKAKLAAEKEKAKLKKEKTQSTTQVEGETKKRGKKGMDEKSKNEIVKMYKRLKSISEVVKESGKSVPTVRKVLIEKGVLVVNSRTKTNEVETTN